MIVQQIGYLKFSQVQNLLQNGDLFSVYKTNKNTYILILNTIDESLELYRPKQDRLPWKAVNGKKITKCKRVYSSNENIKITKLGWNNNEQILAYKEFDILQY